MNISEASRDKARLALTFGFVPVWVWLGCVITRYGAMILVGHSVEAAYIWAPIEAALAGALGASRLTFGTLALWLGIAYMRSAGAHRKKAIAAVVLGALALLAGLVTVGLLAFSMTERI